MCFYMIRLPMIPAPQDRSIKNHVLCPIRFYKYYFQNSITFQRYFLLMGRTEANPVYPALSPFKINCDVTLCLHSPDFSILPFIRKCRKQQDMPFPALDKHLCNCSCKAKIPIDLERRMRTKHVGINAASHTGNIFLPGITELVFQKPQCMFPVP